MYWIVLVLLIPLIAFAASSVSRAQEAPPYLRLVRAIETGGLGVPNPAGLAFSPRANTFLVVQARAMQQPATDTTGIFMITHLEDFAGSVIVAAAVSDPLNLVFDGKANRLLILDVAHGRLSAIQATPTGRLDPRLITGFDAQPFGLQNPRGMTVDPASGRLFILDSAGPRIVRIDPGPGQSLDGPAALRDGRIFVVDLRQTGLVDLRGIAFNPADGHLYVLSPAKQALYELTETGQVVATRDLSSSDDFRLINPQGLVFAPSGDQTDDPSQLSLYLADNGLPELTTTPDNINTTLAPGSQSAGQIVELSFLAPAALPSGTTLLPTTLVHIIDTSNAAWSPSAPDPAGVDYWPLTGRLLISDSEVEEMPPYWQGKNVFQSTTSGTLVSTCSTTAYSKEPTGVAINPNNNHIFFSDDTGSNDKVFEVTLGSDGNYCTPDDTVAITNVGGLYGVTDAEDVAYGNNTLFVAGGVDAEVYGIPLGADGVLGGGDDGLMTHFDTLALGFTDLEGIGFNSDSSTLFIVSTKGTDRYLGETTATGTLINAYDLSLMGSAGNIRSDVSYAPGSQDSLIKNIYIASRGVDNNSNSNENDGKVWEINLSSAPPPPPPSGDPIFADGFESGDLSAWSASITDGGDLSVSAAAALVGSNGLQAVIDDNIAIYVTDDTPIAEPRYHVRFYFDPNTIPMVSGESHFIFYGYSGTSTIVLRVPFRFSNGNYQLRGALRNDSTTWTNTSWFTISDAPHFVELDWQAATAAGANDGGLTLWIDGVQRANLSGIDNDTRRIDRARLGPVGGIDAGTRGTYYFDAFESRRQTYIGP